MAERRHHYCVRVSWIGGQSGGTVSVRAYSRHHLITAVGKPAIEGSSDPAFRGDPARWNPEELLLASLSACHELWYLGLCAQAGVTVTGYEDVAEGWMVEEADGAGQFTSVVLTPRVTLAGGADRQAAVALHQKAHAMCFIARSVNFPVECRPEVS